LRAAKRDFDQVGNFIPYSQIDGDLRAARARIAELEAAALYYANLRAEDPITETALEKFFEPFFRGDVRTSR
jgi:hypothetical protein